MQYRQADPGSKRDLSLHAMHDRQAMLCQSLIWSVIFFGILSAAPIEHERKLGVC